MPVGVFSERDGPFSMDMVVQELLAGGIRARRLVCQSLASDHFLLELDLFQLVVELGCVRAFNRLVGRGQGQLEREVVLKGLRVGSPVVGQDLVVQADPILFAVSRPQLGFLCV